MMYNTLNENALRAGTNRQGLYAIGVAYLMTKYTPQEQDRLFWKKVAITANDDLCWEWQASCVQDGYGHFTRNNKTVVAHRFAWSYPDYIIPDGIKICHSCDNPKCCNPKHLFLGSNQDNMDDMKRKGRSPNVKGEKNPRAILTFEIVSEIRQRFSTEKIRKINLAREYNISNSQIHRILSNEHWKE